MNRESRPLSLEEMRELLAEVDRILDGKLPPGMVYNLYAVGGIAMAAATDEKRLTVDIDVVTTHIPETVLNAVKDVAERRELNTNWINNEVAEMISADLVPSCFQDVYRGKNLVIAGAKPDTLLALKLMSGRGKDLNDIVELSVFLGVTSSDGMIKICDDVFENTARWSLERDFVEQVCRDIVPLVRKHIAGANIESELGMLAIRYDGTDTNISQSPTRFHTWRERRRQKQSRPRTKQGKRKPPSRTKVEQRTQQSTINPIEPQPSCGHVGSRSRKRCILRRGHRGNHRYN